MAEVIRRLGVMSRVDVLDTQGDAAPKRLQQLLIKDRVQEISGAPTAARSWWRRALASGRDTE